MGFNVMNLVLVAIIILVLFGTKKLRTLGSDLGESIKGFKKAMSDDKSPDTTSSASDNEALNTDSEANVKKENSEKES